MWVSGCGGEPQGNVFISDDVDYDMDVLCIDISEREDTNGRNKHNPNGEWLRTKYREEKKARKQRRK